jgi:hypothetical protein
MLPGHRRLSPVDLHRNLSRIDSCGQVSGIEIQRLVGVSRVESVFPTDSSFALRIFAQDWLLDIVGLPIFQE